MPGTQLPSPSHAGAGVSTPSTHDGCPPQDAPAGALPLSAHLDVPDAHDVFPVLQGFEGWQVALAVHALQLPALHTLLDPHALPFEALPVSAQTEVPVTHEVTPVRQAFDGWQPAPEVHETQVPLLQTLFIPQAEPLARFLPVSEQLMLGEQTVTPAWQGFGAVQASPAAQTTHVPLLQTMLVPQDIPLATLPASVQTGTPLSHATAPVRQGLPETTQLMPTLQSTQAD